MVEGNSSQPQAPETGHGQSSSYVLFISKPTGYELAERQGEPPPPGAEVEIGDDGGRYVVAKIGASPLPGDARLCVFVEGAQP